MLLSPTLHFQLRHETLMRVNNILHAQWALWPSSTSEETPLLTEKGKQPHSNLEMVVMMSFSLRLVTDAGAC